MSTPVQEIGAASAYADALLECLDARAVKAHEHGDEHPDVEWALSGAMALTGHPEGPPVLAPGPLASVARGTLEALARVAGHDFGWNGATLLGERAAHMGLVRAGRTSAGGSCRLLQTLDGWLAVNLARPEDEELVPAWLGVEPGEDVWSIIEKALPLRAVDATVDRARLLGLPVAPAAPPPHSAATWLRVAATGPAARRERGARPLVADLSALWAGPLCGHLLAAAGARVFKVESLARPDGARVGAREGASSFYDLINGNKASVALDFGSEAGRAQLRQLLESVDIVIESARPRALQQLGIDVEELVGARAGLTWVSLTGYGRGDPQSNWVAFGDDASAAAGLARSTGAPDDPIFCGDAIADPLAGLHAALAAQVSFGRGGGELFDLSLRDVCAHAAAFQAPVRESRVEAGGQGFVVVRGEERTPVRSPFGRTAARPAPSLGADTRALLGELGIPC